MWWRGSLLALSALTIASSTDAQQPEYCVSCEGPPAVYRCAIEAEPSLSRTLASAQLFCVTELARTGGHTNCSVERSARSSCEGQLAVLRPPLGPEPAETAAPVQTVTPPGDPQPTVARELEKAGQAASETAAKAGNQISSAGKAVGSTAQKTWDCLTSLFSDCWSEQNPEPALPAEAPNQ